MQVMTAKDVAKDLGLSERTIQRYCKLGFLPAKQFWQENHNVYHIYADEFFQWKTKNFKGLKRGSINKYKSAGRDLTKEQIINESKIWLEWCATGKLNGKPIAPRTIELYGYYFGLFLEKLGKRPKKPLISIDNAREVLGSIAVESFSTKLNIYSALMSFSKYLIETGKLEDKEFRSRLKSLRPKRFLPAKKTSLNESQLNELLNKVDGIGGCYSNYDRLTAKALVVFLSNTGLRASECCSLKLKDVDLEARKVYVNLGKGNKNRIVGINEETYTILLEYLTERLKRKQVSDYETDNFFINRLGNSFNNESLSKKINKLAKRIGLKNIGAHSLRRSFVTINANKGKPLNHLRIACGHADLSTTQGYCMTSVDEVVEAMKNW